MLQRSFQHFGCRALLGGLFVAGMTGLTGCQVHVGGQTLPSPYYLTDDVQYFAPGPEFKLAREAAALKAYEADLETRPTDLPR